MANLTEAPARGAVFSKLKDTLKPSDEREVWDNFVTVAFMVAVAMDPLFLYIPIIDQDNKCFGVDKNAWTVSLISRLLLDFIALVHLLCQLHVLFKKNRGNGPQVSITYVIIDVLALLPIPQLVMGVAIYKIWGSGSFRHLNVFIGFSLLVQYLPRIVRLRQPWKRIRHREIMVKAAIYRRREIMFKAAIYFLLYSFAGHVLGALWYFFSIQREISCWHFACLNHHPNPKRCIDAFYCDRQTIASRNITFLKMHCSIDILDNASSVPFNFGIYLDALKNGIVGHVNFSKKFLYCFWWGLRNISNFGTNLMTSTAESENMFVIYISMISFLAITIFAGTAIPPPQAPVSEQRRRKCLMENPKSRNVSGDNISVDPEIDKKMEENEDADLKNDIFSILPAETRERLQRFLCMEILRTAPVSEQRRNFLMENLKSWNISGHDLPVDLEKEILSSIDKNVEENEDAGLKNDIFSILPAETREPLQRFLCMEILRTVPVLEMMGTQALKQICDNLKPVTYKENSFIFRMGDPLDCMLFIIKGTVWTYSCTSSTSATSSKMAVRLLGKGQFYGEELLNSPDFTQLPISTEHVKTRGKVQAFALMADDLATVVANNRANNDDIVEIN